LVQGDRTLHDLPAGPDEQVVGPSGIADKAARTVGLLQGCDVQPFRGRALLQVELHLRGFAAADIQLSVIRTAPLSDGVKRYSKTRIPAKCLLQHEQQRVEIAVIGPVIVDTKSDEEILVGAFESREVLKDRAERAASVTRGAIRVVLF